jgi:hypothetical protein
MSAGTIAQLGDIDLAADQKKLQRMEVLYSFSARSWCWHRWRHISSMLRANRFPNSSLSKIRWLKRSD